MPGAPRLGGEPGLLLRWCCLGVSMTTPAPTCASGALGWDLQGVAWVTRLPCPTSPPISKGEGGRTGSPWRSAFLSLPPFQSPCLKTAVGRPSLGEILVQLETRVYLLHKERNSRDSSGKGRRWTCCGHSHLGVALGAVWGSEGGTGLAPSPTLSYSTQAGAE